MSSFLGIVKKKKIGVNNHHIMMFSLEKVNNLRARERERVEKGSTNSTPMITKLKEIIVAQASHSGMASSVAKKSE